MTLRLTDRDGRMRITGRDGYTRGSAMNRRERLGEFANDFRLTLVSGSPYVITDQTAKTTIYLTSTGHGGNRIELYEGSRRGWQVRTTGELSITVPSTLFRTFDIFSYWTGSAVALEAVNWNQTTKTITAATAAAPCVVTSASHLLANADLIGIGGVVGTLGTDTNNGINGKVFTVANKAANTLELQGSDTSGLVYTSDGTAYTIPNTRATALTTQNGRYVKTGDASRLYLGTGMTHGTSGQTEDSVSRRLLWNAYNQQLKPLRVLESTDSWNYTTAAFRPSNNRIANRVEMVRGLDEDAVDARVYSLTSNTVGVVAVAAAIGLKQTAAQDSQLSGAYASITNQLPHCAFYRGFPGLGYSYLQWIEYSAATGVTTWYGDAGIPTVVQCGLQVEGWF